MKSTGWIAVVGGLMAAPVFAQFVDSPAEFTNSEAISVENAIPHSGETESFETEFERLRKELAAIKSLREQVAAEANQPLTNDVANAHELRRELLSLLTKLAMKNASPKVISEPSNSPIAAPAVEPKIELPKAETKAVDTESDIVNTHKIVDPFALGRALFRAGDYRGAEQAFRKVQVQADNRVLLQYLIATCLRKQSQWEKAALAYRVVAENKEDDALRELALWQLENIRWHQQTKSQLEQLRELRPPSETPKSAPQSAGAGVTPR